MLYDESENLSKVCIKPSQLILNNGLPVRETYSFLASETKYTNKSIELAKKYDDFKENVELNVFDNIKIITDFLKYLNEDENVDISFTLKKSNALTYDIAYIPFKYKKKQFIATWLYGLFSSNTLNMHPVFFQLKDKLLKFENKIHKVYAKCKNGDSIVIDYETDDKINNNFFVRKSAIYCSSCKKKVLMY